MWCLRGAARPCFKASAYKVTCILWILVRSNWFWYLTGRYIITPCVYTAFLCCRADVSLQDSSARMLLLILLQFSPTGYCCGVRHISFFDLAYTSTLIYQVGSPVIRTCRVRIFCTRYFFTDSKYRTRKFADSSELGPRFWSADDDHTR